MKPFSATCILALFFYVASCDLRDDVIFFLYTNDDNNGTELDNDNLDVVDTEDPFVVLIHGWAVNSSTFWVVDLEEEFLDEGDYNIIAVDYTPIAELDYISAVADSRAIGEYVGELIANLYANYSANLSSFHIIGHSLGGQIAGLAGKTVQSLTGSSVARITGLDPAGPLFLPSDPEGRLTSTDADLVVVLHTDGLIFGYYYEVGDIDFYANGGTAPQPGCLATDLQSRCSHGRAVDFYVEAVRNPDGFVATECSDYLLYELKTCSGNRNITLGGNLTLSDAGKYYFNTNSESPYSEE